MTDYVHVHVNGIQGCKDAGSQGGLMGVTEKIWGALASMIKLEDKVSRQAEGMKSQQERIEDLAARVIRLEAHLELLTGAALVKKCKGD